MLKTLALYYLKRAANGTADPKALNYRKNDEARREIEALYDMLGYDLRYAYVDNSLLSFEDRADLDELARLARALDESIG